jgi:predicted RNA-binding protein YlxR (DUF448 family)
MNDRTCIVSRQRREPDELIRFVVGPDGAVVPDLKRNLPGRGCWVTADRLHVERAASKNLFSRVFKRQVSVQDDLADVVDALLARSALGLLGLARKAGAIALGATKVEALVRSGEALAVLHAHEAAEDGVRKIAQARRAVAYLGGPRIPAFKLFPEAEMGLALGGTNVIHAAVLAKDAGAAAVRRLHALDRYRGGSPDDEAMFAAIAEVPQAAEDME